MIKVRHQTGKEHVDQEEGQDCKTTVSYNMEEPRKIEAEQSI